MPIEPLNNPSLLSDPAPRTAPLIPGISGRKNDFMPLTHKSYEFLKEKFQKTLERTKKIAKTWDDIRLGDFLDRPKIPRLIALKIADLTESYNEQLWELVTAAFQIESDADEPFGPELEGRLVTGREIAKQFQQAFEEIQRCYNYIRAESSLQLKNALSEMQKIQPFDPLNKDWENFCKKYHIITTQGHQESKYMLLPLILGRSVAKNRENTLNYLLKQKTVENKSMELIATGNTLKTTITLLHQVLPIYNTRVFSDHAGFVAKYSTNDNITAPLFVYYHSLEHGDQFTNLRTSLTYGASSSMNAVKYGGGIVNSDDMDCIELNNTRIEYVNALYQELTQLVPQAEAVKGSILIVIGECTAEIHQGVLDLILRHMPGIDGALKRVDAYTSSTINLPFVQEGYTVTVVNASKPSSAGKSLYGKGVNALMGYLILHKTAQHNIGLEANLITTSKGTKLLEQNILTLTYGQSNEKHAFAHLLNKYENELANELCDLGYSSVGGDLNNINYGTELVQTSNRSGSSHSVGSNSTGKEMYDKVVIL